MGSTGRRSTDATARRRFPADADEELVECTGGSCRSCTAVIIADCVAVCCCPCAAVSLLGLAFLKVPLVVGRRCLGLLKSKRGSSGKKGRKGVEGGRGVKSPEVGNGGISGIEGEGQGGNENPLAGFEADSVWLELYQLGHWGFGRVSFSGISGKGV